MACGLGALIALSSAPLQSLLLGLALLGYNRIFGSIRFRWLALIVLGAFGVAMAFLISSSPVGFIVSHLIYDPASGYYRIWTWNNVIAAVGQSPGTALVLIRRPMISISTTQSIPFGW